MREEKQNRIIEQRIASFYFKKRREYRKLKGFDEDKSLIWGSLDFTDPGCETDCVVRNRAGNVVAWMEVKDRPTGIPYDLDSSRDTLFIDIAKWIVLMKWLTFGLRPSVLVIRFTDHQVGSFHFKQQDIDAYKTYRMELGGRTGAPRSEDEGRDPVIHIPLTAFKIWGTLSNEELAEDDAELAALKWRDENEARARYRSIQKAHLKSIEKAESALALLRENCPHPEVSTKTKHCVDCGLSFP